MLVERAVFTSTRTSRVKGYHLVARSPGIDYRLAQTLCQWSPSHGNLNGELRRAQSINFFPVTRGAFGLSRTIYGGPEYSGRGGRQVVTCILIVRREHLAGFHNHPLELLRTALSAGLLHLHHDLTRPLPAAHLPDRSLTSPADDPELSRSECFQQLLRLLRGQQRLAIVGLDDPLPTLHGLLTRLPGRERLEMSFCTGLRPSSQRRFRLLFLPAADASLRTQLANQRVSYFPLGQTTTA